MIKARLTMVFEKEVTPKLFPRLMEAVEDGDYQLLGEVFDFDYCEFLSHAEVADVTDEAGEEIKTSATKS